MTKDKIALVHKASVPNVPKPKKSWLAQVAANVIDTDGDEAWLTDGPFEVHVYRTLPIGEWAVDVFHDCRTSVYYHAVQQGRG